MIYQMNWSEEKNLGKKFSFKLKHCTGQVKGFSMKVCQEWQVCDLSDKLVRREEFRKKSSVLNLNTGQVKGFSRKVCQEWQVCDLSREIGARQHLEMK